MSPEADVFIITLISLDSNLVARQVSRDRGSNLKAWLFNHSSLTGFICRLLQKVKKLFHFIHEMIHFFKFILYIYTPPPQPSPVPPVP